jgi:enolase-phosphatase E1
MIIKQPAFILTDIEGTTTSISFVADELFPYFRNNIQDLKSLKSNPVVENAFSETIHLALELDHESISTDDEIIDKLFQWSVEDRKITPLKAVQGVLWDKGYKDGTLKGHVYPEVASVLQQWNATGIGLGVFSSGSIAAQKLIFGYSLAGDLRPLFSNYFDTTTGGKRETTTYSLIADLLKISPENILFLSDIKEELEAASTAGYQTVQLVRTGTKADWKITAADFNEIQFI